VVVSDRSCDDEGFLTPVFGVPIVVRAVTGLLASGVVGEIAVVVRPQVCGTTVRLLRGLPVTVHPDPAGAVAVVERARVGGASAVLLHDAVRPLTPPAIAEAVTRAVSGRGAHGVAVPVLALADTVKHVHPDGFVVGGPDRAGLRVVQTPQAFRPDLLCAEALHRVLTAEPVEHAWATVDAPVATVPGHPLAFAVRSRWDRELADMLAQDAGVRAGT
jgi:2-C-methyl-D-erythritol 4-phosphate cytidylyltransferase